VVAVEESGMPTASYSVHVVVEFDTTTFQEAGSLTIPPPSGLRGADTARPFGLGAAGAMPRLCPRVGYADGVRVPSGACHPTIEQPKPASEPGSESASACPFAAQHFQAGYSGSLRPGARLVSNNLLQHPVSAAAPPTGHSHGNAGSAGSNEDQHIPADPQHIPDERGLNVLHMHFGQFLSHDLSISTQHTPQDINDGAWYDDVHFLITVPKGDPDFDPNGTGTKHLPFTRSKNGLLYGAGVGTGSIFTPRQLRGKPHNPINWVTPSIDGSMVYGSSAKINSVLRSGSGGRMKTTAAGMPTSHEIGTPVANHVGRPEGELMRVGSLFFFLSFFFLSFFSLHFFFAYALCRAVPCCAMPCRHVGLLSIR
jgi:hypothetical protein